MSQAATKTGPLLIGVDAGTTQLRVVIYTASGQPVASASRPTPVTRPQPGWAEHDPDALWSALSQALREAIGSLPRPDSIVALAIASVGEAGVPLAENGTALSPAIAWYDERTDEQAAWLAERLDPLTLFQHAGVRLEPIFSACKILWLQQRFPELSRQLHRWLWMADYLAWRCCGIDGSDYSLASRTLLFDIHRREWSATLCEAAGIDRSILPPLYPGGTPLGRVLPAVAKDTGLPAHCVVAVGGHDHIIGALPAGAWQPGIVLDSMGTAEALLCYLPQPSKDPADSELGYSQGALGTKRPAYYRVAAMLTSGASVEWFRRTLADQSSHETLIARARAVPAGAGGVRFLPQMLTGTAPNPRKRMRGGFVGLAVDTDLPAMYRALLEGLAFDAACAFGGLMVGNSSERIVAIGGNSRNRLLLEIKASVWGKSLIRLQIDEAVTLGAALLAGLAAGVYSSPDDASQALDIAYEQVDPNPQWQRVYQDLLAQYPQLPTALAELSAS